MIFRCTIWEKPTLFLLSKPLAARRIWRISTNFAVPMPSGKMNWGRVAAILKLPVEQVPGDFPQAVRGRSKVLQGGAGFFS